MGCCFLVLFNKIVFSLPNMVWLNTTDILNQSILSLFCLNLGLSCLTFEWNNLKKVPYVVHFLPIPRTFRKIFISHQFPSHLFSFQLFIWMDMTCHCICNVIIHSPQDGSSYHHEYLAKHTAPPQNYIYIYIYIERERERERHTHTNTQTQMMCAYQ